MPLSGQNNGCERVKVTGEFGNASRSFQKLAAEVLLLAIPSLPPSQGGSVLFWVFAGLKRWAEFCCPFGTS
jgi:hypothetical protein